MSTYVSSPSVTPRYTPTVIEANTLTQPTNSDRNLALSEGIYPLRDIVHLGAIPPHPADPPPQPLNVLDTRVPPPTAGSRITLANINELKRTIPHRRPATSESSTDSSESPSHRDATQSLYAVTSLETSGPSTEKGPRQVFGDRNPALAPLPGKESKDPLKRRKPKNNVNKSSSSFVSRFLPHEHLSKRLQEHANDGLYGFVNINRAVLWLDLSSQKKADQLCKILFTKAHALCHDANVITRTIQHMDLAFGFSTNDILWYEPFSQRYSRINKNGVINSTPVSEIRWIPGSENLFIAAHFDGCLVIYDKEKEDSPFIEEEVESKDTADSSRAHESTTQNPRLRVKKSVQSRNQKTNPVAFWRVSNERIRALEFSPSGHLLAAVSEDGALRVIDYLHERLLDLYSAYYGGLTSVAWSPDGKYLLTGGQDDIVSVWSLEERTVVARGVGHHSWISALAFDPWRCDERTYRFGSVGEDCRLLLWDFSVGMLHRPRTASVRQSVSSFALNGDLEQTLSQTTTKQRDTTSTTVSATESFRHAIEPRSATAILPPVLAKIVDEHPMSWLAFEETFIIASCRTGHILTWDRPGLISKETESAVHIESEANVTDV